jgi:hypothetical protein
MYCSHQYIGRIIARWRSELDLSAAVSKCRHCISVSVLRTIEAPRVDITLLRASFILDDPEMAFPSTGAEQPHTCRIVLLPKKDSVRYQETYGSHYTLIYMRQVASQVRT